MYKTFVKIAHIILYPFPNSITILINDKIFLSVNKIKFILKGEQNVKQLSSFYYIYLIWMKSIHKCYESSTNAIINVILLFRIFLLIHFHVLTFRIIRKTKSIVQLRLSADLFFRISLEFRLLFIKTFFSVF